MPQLAFAAIADDLTGATDLAGMLVRGGLRTALAVGVDGLAAIELTDVDAIVVALKTRSVAAHLAVELSAQAAQILLRQGAQRLYFKYCSTFDSTSQGNIGPVAEALRAETGVAVVPFVPSFPENGRRVYRGHLFVGDSLLSESGMELHPLNPMRDPNLVRVLAAQSRLPVALLGLDTVRLGPGAVRQALASFGASPAFAVIDAIDDHDLQLLAPALLELPLVTGGSALGLHMARELASAHPRYHGDATAMVANSGRAAIISGSCSHRTQEQIAYFASRHPALRLQDLPRAQTDAVEFALNWFAAQRGSEPALIYSSAPAIDCADQDRVALGRRIEDMCAASAQGLVARGIKRLLVAGGETSGAVVAALAIRALKIGPEIAPGVSWTRVMGGPSDGVCLALKSGNFGAPDLFTTAFERLEGRERAA